MHKTVNHFKDGRQMFKLYMNSNPDLSFIKHNKNKFEMKGLHVLKCLKFVWKSLFTAWVTFKLCILVHSI